MNVIVVSPALTCPLCGSKLGNCLVACDWCDTQGCRHYRMKTLGMETVCGRSQCLDEDSARKSAAAELGQQGWLKGR